MRPAIGIARPRWLVVADGDSRTAGTYGGITVAERYPNQLCEFLRGRPFLWRNQAVGGTYVPHTSFHYLYPERMIYVLSTGVNAYNGGVSAATLYGLVTTAVNVVRDRGVRFVVVSTTFDSIDLDSTEQIQRLAGNDLHRANAAGADAVIDWSVDPWFDDAANFASPNEGDGVHLGPVGNRRAARIAAAVINPLLEAA